MNKKKLDNIFFNFCHEKLKISMLNLILEICLLNKYYVKNFKELNEISYQKDFLNKHFKILKDVLNKEYKERIEYINEINKEYTKFKKTAIKKIAIFKNLDFAFQNIYQYKKSTDLKYLDKNNLKNDLISLIKNTNLNDNNNLKNSLILSLLPYSFTKDFYKDYIKSSLNLVFSKSTKQEILNLLDIFKFNFYSLELIEDEKLKNRLKELLSLNLENLKEDKIDELLTEIDENISNLKYIETTVLDLSSLFLDMLVMYNLVLSKEDLFKDDFILKDLFNATIDMIENENFDMLIDNIEETVENELDNRLEALIEKEEFINEEISKLKYDDLTENIKLYIKINEICSKNPEEQILIINENCENEIPDSSFVDNKIEEFLNYIQNIDLPNKTLNILKQSFFKNIPCILKDEFLINHSLNIIENFSDSKLKVLKIKILEILEILYLMEDPNELANFIEDMDKDHIHHHNCNHCH